MVLGTLLKVAILNQKKRTSSSETGVMGGYVYIYIWYMVLELVMAVEEIRAFRVVCEG